MKYTKLALCSVLAMACSNLAYAENCDIAKYKTLSLLAKQHSVGIHEISVDKTFDKQSFSADVADIIDVIIGIEDTLQINFDDEDVMEPTVYFDEEEYVPKLKQELTIGQFQDIIYKACVKELS